MCTTLEELGLIALDDERRYVGRAPAADIRAAANHLARCFETQRTEDNRRLRAIVEYAKTEKCRSQFIRRWFEVDDGRPCGRCDNCRIEI